MDGENLIKIRLLCSVAGVNISYAKGEIVEVPESIARALVDANYAEIVETPPPKKAEKRPSSKV